MTGPIKEETKRKRRRPNTATIEKEKSEVIIPEVVVKSDGTPKAVKSDGTPDRRGGYRPGAGRKPIHDRLTNYNKAIKMLDDSVEEAIQVLVDGLSDDDKYFRVRCAELLLKKTLADKKQNEHVGPNGGPIQVQHDYEDAIERINELIEDRMKPKTIESRNEH